MEDFGLVKDGWKDNIEGLAARRATISSLGVLGAAVKAGMAVCVTEVVGRLRTLQMFTVVWMSGYLTVAFSSDNTGLLLFARTWVGVGAGGLAIVAPLFLSVISKARNRGMIVSVYMVSLLTTMATSTPLHPTTPCRSKVASSSEMLPPPPSTPSPSPSLQQQQQQQQQHPHLSGASQHIKSNTANGSDCAQNRTSRPGKRPPPRGAAFYPRKRATTACQVCRARKTKCDNVKPSCSYCVSVGATCVQTSAVDLSSLDPASLKILDRLDSLERLLRSAISANGDDAADASTRGVVVPDVVAASAPVPHPPRRPSTYGMYGHGHGPRDNDYNSLFGHRSNQAFNEGVDDGVGLDLDLHLHSVLPTRVNRIFEWPIFRGSSGNNTNIIKIKATSPPTTIRTPPDATSLPAGWASLAALVDMESYRLYRLLDNFFLYIHCKNPILDECSTRRLVRRVFLDGIDWSSASCLALIICALGCIATPFGPSPETRIGSRAYADSQVFFQAAQKRIGILLVRSDMVGAQCLFLSGIYMMMVFQPIYAWRFFSQALAACQHLPFLTRAQHEGAMSNPEATSAKEPSAQLHVDTMSRRDTQEQAVYWSSWKSERELRSELSLPDFDIACDHAGTTLYPPFFPAPPVPAPDSPDDDGTQRSRASWLFYLAEISLRRLTSRLCCEVMGLRRRYASNTLFLDALADMTPEYEAQAQEWSENLPGELSVHSAIDDDGIARSVLRGKLINLYEMLYWPFVMASLGCGCGCSSSSCPSSPPSSSHHHCHPKKQSPSPLKKQYVHLARRGLDTHMHQIRANEPAFFHRHHGSFFMIRACVRSALTLVAAVKADLSMPGGWREAVYKVVGMLAYWQDEDGDVRGWKARLEVEMEMALTLTRER
ncbi:hypothetical protein E4U21_000478 [Claviceps maximensis]|nr:hypothetical protein E4U21_000478 [Claviceps maximensis]